MQFANQVFVFKATSQDCYRREVVRSRALGLRIKELNLDGTFGFVDHMAQTETEPEALQVSQVSVDRSCVG
jgi:hypothetical protein